MNFSYDNKTVDCFKNYNDNYMNKYKISSVIINAIKNNEIYKTCNIYNINGHIKQERFICDNHFRHNQEVDHTQSCGGTRIEGLHK